MKPRIIVPKHSSRDLPLFLFVPIEGNRILIFAEYIKFRKTNWDEFLHLSIHEIRSDSRVGPALWSFNSSVASNFHDFDFELIKSTGNPLAITFGARLADHWKLFDISTAETDTSDNLPLIEPGRIDFDLKIKELKWVRENSLGLFQIFMQC